MSLLTKLTPLKSLRRAFTRVINIESVPAFDSYEHSSNMKTKDLFQFEPFNNSDLENFPRERPGKDYDLNWSLASEWFTVWGDAYRNADRALLLSHLKCIRDDNNNAYCKRTYREDVPSCSKDFEELSDNVKEFLSKVPNLYVEDAAIASGRLLETRIRSVTNDPATALVMKNLLHCMPLRHPQTPHPLGLIVARGMKESFTSIGMDPHSRALTVLIAGDVSIHRIITELEKATEMYITQERGVIEVPEAPGAIPIKGPLTKCIIPCSTLVTKEGKVKCAFGLSQSTINSYVNQRLLFCSSDTIVSNMGISRLFAGCECDADKMDVLKNEMVLNQKVYKPLEGDNLLEYPSEVVFVQPGSSKKVLTEKKEIENELKKYIKNDEYIPYLLSKLENSSFCISDSVVEE